MRSQYKTFFIFSACREALSTNENHKRTREAYNTLLDLGLDFACVTGVYNGSKEASFMVFDSEGAESTVKTLCELYSQECYLERDNENKGELVFPNNTRELLGTVKVITREESKDFDSFTIAPQTDGTKLYFTFAKDH